MLERLQSSFDSSWHSLIEHVPDIVFGVAWLGIFTLLGIILRYIVKNQLLRKLDDPLLKNFIGRVVFLIMIILGVVLFLNQVGLGKAAGGLLAGAGVSALILGFAFKDIGENFLAGFFLAFSRPFNIGDVIEIQNLMGQAKALSFRNTHIRTFDGKDIFIPNASLIKHPLINYTRDGLQRFDFVLGIDYGEDVTKVTGFIMSTLSKELRIEQDGDLAPFLQLEEFSTSTINLRIFYWINSYNFTGSLAKLKTSVMNNVITECIKNNINLPADIIELKIYNKEQPIPINIDSKS